MGRGQAPVGILEKGLLLQSLGDDLKSGSFWPPPLHLCLFLSGFISKPEKYILLLKIVKERNAWQFKTLFALEANTGRLFPESCQGPVAAGRGWHLSLQLCKFCPSGAWVWRGDTWLCVGKTDTVCHHPSFLLIYFYHFFMAFYKTYFPGSSFTGQGRKISICIIFHCFPWVPPPKSNRMLL